MTKTATSVIVDTSALVAAATSEAHGDALRRALLQGGLVPAPVVVEFQRVITGRGSRPAPEAEAFLDDLIARELRVEPFTAEDAAIAAQANAVHGEGNGRGGTLNLLDLMVYAIARRMDLPILCTGRDFSVTDIQIHPASRTA